MSQLEANSQANRSINRMVLLVIGDFLVILFFIWLGRRSHAFSNTGIMANLATAAPFLLGWFLITPWFGLFRAEVSQNWRKLVPRLLLAWAIGGPLAQVLRALFLGRPIPGGIIPIFALITLIGTALFMLIWRLGYIWWINRRPT